MCPPSAPRSIAIMNPVHPDLDIVETDATRADSQCCPQTATITAYEYAPVPPDQDRSGDNWCNW